MVEVRRGKPLRFLVATVLFISVFIISAGVARADTTDSTTYGSGNYGYCDYGSCTITLTSGGSTTLNVAPTPSGQCTVQSDTASVLTDSTAGYVLTMTTSTTNNSMTSGANNITASSGTSASPTTLAMNTWGYRVDGLAGFGAGPTSSQSNGSVPSVTFAGVPPSNLAGTAVASSSGPANPAVDTTVWYGVCANSSLPSGSYSTTVTYTAVTN
jgi:hypothetical protein